MGSLSNELNSQECGVLKLGLLWLEQMNSQRYNKRTYIVTYQNLECITAFS